MTQNSDQERNDTEGALRRWSRRKLEQARARQRPENEDSQTLDADEQNALAEAGSEFEIPVGQLPSLETLSELFKRPEFATPCPLNDYDRDLSGFAPLDGILTHDYKRYLARRVADACTKDQADILCNAFDANVAQSAPGIVPESDPDASQEA